MKKNILWEKAGCIILSILMMLSINVQAFAFESNDTDSGTYQEENQESASSVNDSAIVIGNETAHIGETVHLTFVLKNSDTLKSIALSDISYDSNSFELIDGKWKIQNSAISDVNLTKKTAVIGFENNTDCNGDIFELTFKVKDGASDGTYPISCSITAKRKEYSGENAYNIASVSGSIAVTSIQCGDVNGDEAVDSDDAIHLLYNTLIPDLYPVNQDCDFDGNGEVNSDDAIYLLYYTLLPDIYPLNITAQVNKEKVMIVAAEGFKLNSNVENALGATIDYSEYDALVDVKKAMYVGFIFLSSNKDDINTDGKVFVLPVEQFGLDSVSRTDVGSVYDVVLTDWNVVSNDTVEIYGFDSCDRSDNFTIFDKSEFSFGSHYGGNIYTVTIDGQTYYGANRLQFDYTTDGTKNSAYENDIVIIDTFTNTVVNGTTVETGDYANLACYDINGDGKYDIAYYITYRMGKVWSYSEDVWCTNGGYNLLSKSALTVDLEGNKVNLAEGGYYLIQTLDWDGANMPKNGSGIAIVRKAYTPTVTGLVTGIDLNRKTVTLDGIDAENPGTTYKIGCGTLGGKIGDTALADFNMNLFSKRVSLYIDEDLNKVIAMAVDFPAPAPVSDRGTAYVFIQDTGRTLASYDEINHPIIEVYDNRGVAQYMAVYNPAIVETLNKGDLLRLCTAEDGLYNVELFETRFDPNFEIYDVDIGEGAPVNKYHIMDWINYYWDLNNAVILFWNGNEFEEYAGADLGEGSKISGTVYMERASMNNKILDMTFIYVYDGDVEVAPVTVDSYAEGSIVFIGSDVNNYAYANYGALESSGCLITIYNAADMIDGTFKTVTVNGKYGDILPVGFYYIDKNNKITGIANDEIVASDHLHICKYQTIVSDDASMAVNAYKKDSLSCVRFRYDGTNTNDWTGSMMGAGAGTMHVTDAYWDAVPVTCGKIYSYQGSLYGSDVSVALVTAMGLELVTGEIEAPVLMSANKGTFSLKYEIPKSMYDTVIKDANGNADLTGIAIGFNAGSNVGSIVVSNYVGFVDTEVRNHLLNTVELINKYNNGEINLAIRFFEKDGRYFMDIQYLAFIGCPVHGGFEDDTVTSITWNGTDSVAHTLAIDFPCYSAFFGE